MKTFTRFFSFNELLLLFLIAFLSVALLGGCASLRDYAVQMKAPDKAAQAVDLYCKELPYSERIKNRDSINALTTVGKIRVDCEGDPAP